MKRRRPCILYQRVSHKSVTRKHTETHEEVLVCPSRSRPTTWPVESSQLLLSISLNSSTPCHLLATQASTTISHSSMAILSAVFPTPTVHPTRALSHSVSQTNAPVICTSANLLATHFPRMMKTHTLVLHLRTWCSQCATPTKDWVLKDQQEKSRWLISTA